MNIQTARINASHCRSLASKFQKLSPTAQKVSRAFGGSTLIEPKNWFGRQFFYFIKRILYWKMDKLILVNDPSVQVMILKAMSIIGYRSRHLGFIATLYVSKEIGHSVDQKGDELPSSEVSMEVWRYFLNLLDVQNYFNDLEKYISHWEGVLNVDYTKEFSKEECWDFSGEELVHIKREVPSEEVKKRIDENKANVRRLYWYDLNEVFQKNLSGYYERRPIEVYECLDEIFEYIFQEKLNDELIGAVLEMLADIARRKYFPEKWLIELSQKHVI